MAELLHERILAKESDPQTGSPLFCRFPAEVRDNIFSHVLTDHPDTAPHQQYRENACYTRPFYFAVQSTDVRLLRTCRAIYRETWFKPFLLREQTKWATNSDRSPPRLEYNPADLPLPKMLKKIAKKLGEDKVEIERLRVFAQMFKLEEGGLAEILSMPLLAPRTLTLTIRHTDWWCWEDDEPLHFDGHWIKDVCNVMSTSTNQICIELESLERKKDQVNKIADQMVERWFFKRSDGTILFADTTASRKVSRWRGSSTWQGQRWIRDETEPEKLDYYIVSVVFQPQFLIERRGGKISDMATKFAQNNIFDNDNLGLSLPDQKRIEDPKPYELVYDSEDGEDDDFVCMLWD
ncbi:hypothetical protein FSARC_5476 [Fusarium sarcochroum]|uniref:Uncharacterized protein n=1 Tax=Fusarium sarcochroum TaxID=1208366 RepID=A0A8H4TZG9_9HYPO|nr:hypothetical protein FSARC_5476 [Fusarium sarcochroum]